MPNPPGSLKYHELIRRLKKFGVEEHTKRGKGSERYLVRPIVPGSTRGPSTTIHCHGSGDEIKIGSITACLRRLAISPEEFWS